MTEMRPMFLPSPDGVRDVMRRARARRRRRALVTTGGFAVAAAITGVLIGTAGAGTGADRLTVVPAAPDHGSPRPAPGGTAPVLHSQPPAPSSKVGPQAPVSSGASPRQDGGSSWGNAFPVRHTPSPAPTPYAPTKRQSADAPISRSAVAYNSACDATYDVQGWCTLYTGPSDARRKHPFALSMELCRPSVVGDGTLHFTNTRQIQFSLADASGTTVWQAGQGIAYKNKDFSVVVKAGTCLRWISSWDTISANGFYAPPGDYNVTYGFDSSDIGTTSGDRVTLAD